VQETISSRRHEPAQSADASQVAGWQQQTHRTVLECRDERTGENRVMALQRIERRNQRVRVPVNSNAVASASNSRMRDKPNQATGDSPEAAAQQRGERAQSEMPRWTDCGARGRLNDVQWIA